MDLDTLLDRVSAATGPDYDLSAVIWMYVAKPRCDIDGAADWYVGETEIRAYGQPWPHVTGSLDAALQFVRVALPGHEASMCTHRKSCLLAPDGIYHASTIGNGATLPLAVMHAALQWPQELNKARR